MEDYDFEEDLPEKSTKKRGTEEVKWVIEQTPQIISIVNPKTKEVMAQHTDVEVVKLQLLALSAQYAMEAAKNTR